MASRAARESTFPIVAVLVGPPVDKTLAKVLGTRTSAASPSFLLGPGQPHDQDCPPLTAPSGPLAAVAAFWSTEENTIGYYLRFS
jgi:hypothetical protein